MKKPSLSLVISDITVKTAFVLVGAAMIGAPWLIKVYDDANISRGSVYIPLMITAYLACVPAIIALFSLNKLLSNLKKGDVFVENNTKMLRILSYCCFAEALIFCAFGYFRPLSFVVFVAAAFMGLILRVLKNVFSEAVALREENDFTI